MTDELTDGLFDERVRQVRAFNRFYTRQIGLLNESILESPFTLAEARVLYEILLFGERRATDLCAELFMDPAQVSRIIQRLKGYDLLEVGPSEADGRARTIRLGELGRKAAETLDLKSSADIARMLEDRADAAQTALISAMNTIAAILAAPPAPGEIILRPHRIGELGWLIHRQGLLYHEEFGWNGEFEALIARIYHEYETAPETPGKGLWIAELNGSIAGSVFILPAPGKPGISQLRMLYTEPFARGQGIGGKLVDQAVRFSREAGYEGIILWTQSCLADARRIYERAGFTQISEEPHHSFGADLVGQYLELKL